MTQLNVAAIICVRMTSARLPGKPMLSYHPDGKTPNLKCIVNRVKTSRHNPVIIVATSTDKSDDVIASWTNKRGLLLYRGELDNVVKRFDGAVKTLPMANYVWRVMADCPL